MLKILLTAGVIYAVWLLYKYRSRIAAVHKTVMEENARAPVAQDLVPCPKCGAYAAAGTVCSCEKA